MLQNIIKNRRDKTYTLKIVYGQSNESEDAMEELEEYKDNNQHSLKKMQLLYKLKDIQLTTVSNNLFIIYHFENKGDTKEFEIAFSKNILDDGSNLLDTFMITQQLQEKKEEEEFKVILELPEKAVDSLGCNDFLLNVTLLSEPSCPVYMDMLSVNKKKVRLLDKDLDKPIVNISYRVQGTTITRSVPQRWLTIEEIVYKATVNTQWALNPKNIISMDSKGVLSDFEDKEVFTSIEVIKNDGKSVKLYKREDKFFDTVSEIEYLREHLIFEI